MMISDNYTIPRLDRHYHGFITRRDLINRTGIYMTEEYFADLYYKFLNSGKTADEFIEDFETNVEDRVIETTMPKAFRYMQNDERISRIGDHNFTCPEDGINVYELLDSLVVDCDRREVEWEELSFIFWEVVCRYIKQQNFSSEMMDRMKELFERNKPETFDSELIRHESEKLKVKEIEYGLNQEPKRIVMTHEDRLNDYMYQYSVESEMSEMEEEYY